MSFAFISRWNSVDWSRSRTCSQLSALARMTMRTGDPTVPKTWSESPAEDGGAAAWSWGGDGLAGGAAAWGWGAGAGGADCRGADDIDAAAAGGSAGGLAALALFAWSGTRSAGTSLTRS